MCLFTCDRNFDLGEDMRTFDSEKFPPGRNKALHNRDTARDVPRHFYFYLSQTDNTKRPVS